MNTAETGDGPVQLEPDMLETGDELYVLWVSPVGRLRVWSGPYGSAEAAASSTAMRDALGGAFIARRLPL